MITIEFEYLQNKIIIQGNLQEKFQEAINKFIGKTSLNPQNLTFLANGNICKSEMTLESQMSNQNKINNFMPVSVMALPEREKKKEPVFVPSKEIICPKCFEPCSYKIENYRIKLYGCKNNHITDDIKLKDFPNLQKMDISKISCDNCKNKTKGEIEGYLFFRCLTCSTNLCLLCQDNHTKKMPNHKIIKYEEKYFNCPQHYESFTNYCQNCKKIYALYVGLNTMVII